MNDKEKLLSFIDEYGCGRSPSMTDEEICRLCYSVSVTDGGFGFMVDGKSEKEYLKILQFINEEGFKFGVDPSFFEDTSLFGDFVNIYLAYDANDPRKKEFFHKVENMSLPPNFRNSFPALDRLLKDAISQGDREVISWVAGDWVANLMDGEDFSMDLLGAVMACEIADSDVEIQPEYGAGFAEAYWNVFMQDLSDVEIEYFAGFMMAIIEKSLNGISFKRLDTENIISALQRYGFVEGVTYFSDLGYC